MGGRWIYFIISGGSLAITAVVLNYEEMSLLNLLAPELFFF